MTTGDTVELHHLLERPEEAPVLVLSNSLGATLAMWDEQAAALSERFRLLRYDHRGHGGSPVPPDPYTIERLRRDVVALLDRLEVKRFSFCGLSIGGMVGMWLASGAPGRGECLGLCCTSARFAPRFVRFSRPDGPGTRCRCRRRCRAGALVHSGVPREPPGRHRMGPAYAARHSRRRLRRLLRGDPGC